MIIPFLLTFSLKASSTGITYHCEEWGLMGDKHLIDARPYLFPAPCVVVSCSDGEATNLITLAWAGTVCSEPPQVGIGVRKSRYSHGLLNTGGDFVVNIPAAEHTRAVDFCGVRSGREVDKWEAVGLTPLPAAEVGSPLVAEFPINLECAVRRVLELGSHDLFIGEVLVVHVTTSLPVSYTHLRAHET